MQLQVRNPHRDNYFFRESPLGNFSVESSHPVAQARGKSSVMTSSSRQTGAGQPAHPQVTEHKQVTAHVPNAVIGDTILSDAAELLHYAYVCLSLC